MSDELSLARTQAGPVLWHALTLAVLGAGLVYGGQHGVLPTTLLGCLAGGLLSGVLAGMLGIGGGFVVVPAMIWLLPASTAPAALLPQMAVATSLAAMIPTTLAALLAQRRRGGVERDWLRRLLPGACAGAALGAVLLPAIAPGFVAWAFALYAAYFSARLLLAPHRVELPTPWLRWPAALMALVIGFVSVLAGVGGAILTVPYLESRRVRLMAAVGTSSGIALGLSLVSIAALVMRGTLAGTASLVWWPGAVVVGAAAVLTAPVGVLIGHRLPVSAFKRAFAMLLLLVAVGSAWKVMRL